MERALGVRSLECKEIGQYLGNTLDQARLYHKIAQPVDLSLVATSSNKNCCYMTGEGVTNHSPNTVTPSASRPVL